MTIGLPVRATAAGEAVHRVAAVEKRGPRRTAECRTVVRGVPGIRMEVIDSVDPVKPGGETVYEVKVANTGTETDRNPKLVCDLPPGMALVEASGPVPHALVTDPLPEAKGRRREPDRVVFEAVRELGPKTEAVFKLRVRTKAWAAGGARFKASLTSDHLTTPVTKEESTTVYGD